MRRKMILFGGLFFLVSLLSMGTLVKVAQAEENPCYYMKDCPVPAPTIVVPELDSSTYTDIFVIAGLSWNETLVDVYVDGVYNGRVELNLDDSGIANFAYKTFLPLTPGNHSVYTVARNLNARERSVESPEISFSIEARSIIVLEEIIEEESIMIDESPNDEKEKVASDDFGDNNQEEQLVDDDEETIGVINESEDTNISVVSEEEGGEVNVNEGLPADAGRGQGGQIEGGVWEQNEDMVSSLQRTVDRNQIIDEFFSEDAEIFAEQKGIREKQNRQIGLAMLGVIIVISIVWIIISNYNSSDDEKKIVIRQESRAAESVLEQDKTEDVMDDELDRLV